MKKNVLGNWLFVVVSAVVLASFLAISCAPAPEAPEAVEEVTEEAAPAEAPEKITIVHWQHHHEARTPVVEALAKEFQAQHPNVTIQFEAIPYDAYFDKLITSLASGTGPDVFQIYMEMAEEMIQSGSIVPVPGEVMTTQQIEQTFLPWTVERFKADDKYWGLPTDVQTLVVFINDELFKECGGDPASPPKTWDEFKNAAVDCTERDAAGNIIQAGLDTRYKWAVFTQAMYSFIEGPVVDAAARKANYDNPEGIAAWKLVAELMTGPNAVDSPEFLTGQKKFEQGKAVLYINHPVTRGRLSRESPDIKYTIAPPPYVAGKKLTTPGHHWAYVVNKTAKNQAMAWEWVKFLTSKEGQLKFIEEAGDLPSMKELVKDPSLVTDANAKVSLESLEYARSVQQIGGPEVDEIQSNLWDKIVLEGADVEQVVKEAAAAETEVIEKITAPK